MVCLQASLEVFERAGGMSELRKKSEYGHTSPSTWFHIFVLYLLSSHINGPQITDGLLGAVAVVRDTGRGCTHFDAIVREGPRLSALPHVQYCMSCMPLPFYWLQYILFFLNIFHISLSKPFIIVWSWLVLLWICDAQMFFEPLQPLSTTVTQMCIILCLN